MARKESEFRELQKADTKRMNMLKKCNEDAFQGVLWLRENKYKENFEKPDQIYEPIMTVLRQVCMYLMPTQSFGRSFSLGARSDHYILPT